MTAAPCSRIAVVLVAVVVAGVAWTHAATATPSATATRIFGDDRYGTSRAIAETFPERPGRNAVLVRGDAFADALGAGRLAGSGGDAHGPIILTTPSDLHPEALAALRAADVEIVHIVGSELAIAPAVEQDLRDEGFTVLRHGGEDRYETAAKVNDPGLTSDCECFPEDTAFVASGELFPDALAAGPLAWREGFPLLLTRRDELPEPTRELLASYAKRVYVLGGQNVISEDVADAIASSCRDLLGRPQQCITVERIAGDDRSATSVRVAEFAQRRGWVISHANLARGDAFPDALAGGPHGGLELSPILLTQSPTELSAAVDSFLRANAQTIDSLHVLGSESAVSESVVERAVAAVRS